MFTEDDFTEVRAEKATIIAEIGWNFLGDLKLAEQMIDEAAKAGADYAKFQAWRVDRLKSGPWDHDGRREIYEAAQLDTADHKILKNMCENSGIKYMTSVFSPEDLKDVLDVSDDAIKIPSTECRDIRLIDECIKNFKKVYISTGTTTEEEVAVLIKHTLDCDNVCLMHCVSAYPCEAENLNLRRIANMVIGMMTAGSKASIGYSGHHNTIWDAITALAMGVEAVEKHFTIDRSLPGRDNAMAILPGDLAALCDYNNMVDDMFGSGQLDLMEIEKEARDVYTGRWRR